MLGLRKNRHQFLLLVLVNAFVGAMVGLERSVLSDFGQTDFLITTQFALLSFVAAFGASKAISNYAVGVLARRYTRKQILISGWLIALPVPFMLIYSPTWNWVIAANVLLGISQGLTWSTTVIMKIDLVGIKNRGLAMGINEFAGYLSVGLAAFLAGSLASDFGFRYAFMPGIFFALAGLLLSLFFVKDTAAFVAKEAAESKMPLLPKIWKQTTWQHRNLSTVSLNGLVNNLNDGVVWGMLPLLLLQRNFTLTQVGIIAGTYPVIWGLGQLATGRMGDLYSKKNLIAAGMIIQATAILLFALSNQFYVAAIAAFVLGAGTAMVYPNFLAVVAENTHPAQRAESLSIFRFWRDSGYVIGALLSGLLADGFGMPVSLVVVASITALAGLVALKRMYNQNALQ